jgi:hypothetical protein
MTLLAAYWFHGYLLVFLLLMICQHTWSAFVHSREIMRVRYETLCLACDLTNNLDRIEERIALS